MNKSKYQLFDELTVAEYTALKDDIRKQGILVPVEFDEEGNVLDGHHRIRAWGELKAEGVKGLGDYPSVTRSGLTEEEKLNHVRVLNLLRRHLSLEERDQHIVAMRASGMTYQAIGEAAGVSHMTAKRAVEANGSHLTNVKSPSHIINARGEKRPTTYKPRKPKTVFSKNSRELEKAQEVLAELPADQLPDNLIDTKRLARLGREHKAELRAQVDIEKDVTIGQAKLLHGDFRELGQNLKAGSVDLIFTDPPYPREFLPLWSDLSEFAARVLKPDGMLVAYTGALDLPEVLNRLGEHLEYWWLGSLHLSGPHSRVYARNIAQGSKPLLFFVKDGFTPSCWLEDTFQSPTREKELHEWQQSTEAAQYYIEKLTQPGDLVVDPFLGAGSFATPAIKAGCHFIGFDVDQVAIMDARERVANESN